MHTAIFCDITDRKFNRIYYACLRDGQAYLDGLGWFMLQDMSYRE